MRYHTMISSDRGIAIIAVTMVLVVAALLGGALIAQTSQDNRLAQRTSEDKQALYLAESAKEHAYRLVINDADFDDAIQPGEGEPGKITGVTALPSGEPLRVGSYDLEVNELSATPFVVEIIGTGDSDMGRRRQVVVTAEVIRENVCVWNNAIFGGSGQSGGVINGNCAIHGSVHLLGDNVGEGNNSIEALDLSGSALIHNNYGEIGIDGMPASLYARIPALPSNDDGFGTLNARLRVRNGAVGISGNSEIGEAPIVGATYTTSMYGIYIESDLTETRWTGNQVIDGIPTPGHVFSDNGIDALYDLGDIVTMPTVPDPYDDSDYSGNSYASYSAFFSANSLHVPSLELDETGAAATAIQTYFGAYTPEALAAMGITYTVNGNQFMVSQTTPYGQVNSIAYNPAAAAGVGRLTLSNMIQVDGNLSMGSKKVDIQYAGSGTIFAAGGGAALGDIDVHSDVLPVTRFPDPDAIGLVALNDMNLATGPGDSQLMMAGAFYAQNQVTSQYQNEIAGTFVSLYFDMGTNVPRIYQVPSLVDNLPRGIIGGLPIWVVVGFDERSWRTDFE